MPTKTKAKATITTSKREALLRLLRSNKGATIPEMQKATGWQPHSVRSFLSGIVKKRLGLKLKPQTVASGERRYAITTN